jgi:hypothetical protein
MAPSPADEPGRQIECARSCRVELAGNGNHVIPLVAIREAGQKEHASNVHVVDDVAPVEVRDCDAEVTLEDLHGHRGVLLADAREGDERSSAPAADDRGGEPSRRG